MPDRQRLFSIPWAIESVLMLLILAGIGHLIYKFSINGFLPLPFVYDVSDTFMDWFHPAYWAHDGHAYDIYKTVYAPLSYVILEVLGFPGCYVRGAWNARTCDYLGIAAILASYVIPIILSAIVFWRNERKTAVFRTVAIGLGLPLLYALERGNLIMIAFLFFVIFMGELAKSRGWLTVFAALMINMKSYLLLPVLGLGIRREWRWLEWCGFATIAIYLVTWVIYGAGDPLQLIDNLKVWFTAMDSIVWDQISYSTTYKSFLVFETHHYPVRDFIPEKVVDAFKMFIICELIASRTIAIVCIIFAWLYPKSITFSRLAFFLLMQSFVVENPGGYSQVFIVFLVFMEKWTNARVGIAIITAYLVSIPTDFMFASVLHVERTSWLAGRIVETTYGITLGALFRPMMILIMLWSLAIDSLIEFHRAIKQGPPQLMARLKQTSPQRFSVL